MKASSLLIPNTPAAASVCDRCHTTRNFIRKQQGGGDVAVDSQGLPVSKAGAFAEEQRLLHGPGLLRQPEESVVLHAVLPEGFGHIPTGHGELQGVLAGRLMGELQFQSTRRKKAKETKDLPRTEPHSDFVVQLDEEMFAFEAQLSDLRPAEGVDFGVSLKRTK